LQVYDAEYYRQPAVKALAEEHKKAFGADKLPANGYPDMGNGRYADQLSYADWFKVNSGQRAHYNGVETIAPALASLIIGGLFFPRFAAGAAAAYIIGRELYATGYAANGPAGRSKGAILVDVGLLALVLTSIAAGLQLLQIVKLPGA
jgi:hypothetical protein